MLNVALTLLARLLRMVRSESSNFLQNAGISRSEWKNLPALDRQILPGHGQIFPCLRRSRVDRRNLIFRCGEKSMFKLF